LATSPSASTTPNFGGRTVLANGDEIQMGKFRLVFLTAPTTT